MASIQDIPPKRQVWGLWSSVHSKFLSKRSISKLSTSGFSRSDNKSVETGIFTDKYADAYTATYKTVSEKLVALVSMGIAKNLGLRMIHIEIEQTASLVSASSFKKRSITARMLGLYCLYRSDSIKGAQHLMKHYGKDAYVYLWYDNSISDRYLGYSATSKKAQMLEKELTAINVENILETRHMSWIVSTNQKAKSNLACVTESKLSKDQITLLNLSTDLQLVDVINLDELVDECTENFKSAMME